ncbi:hypothetical protein FKP32DRAFT_1684804 [Trametes sanguinea]|nr:hypothetical protein FKP32DRAFT_1684804 [Trametes sanguinea]
MPGTIPDAALGVANEMCRNWSRGMSASSRVESLRLQPPLAPEPPPPAALWGSCSTAALTVLPLNHKIHAIERVCAIVNFKHNSTGPQQVVVATYSRSTPQTRAHDREQRDGYTQNITQASRATTSGHVRSSRWCAVLNCKKREVPASSAPAPGGRAPSSKNTCARSGASGQSDVRKRATWRQLADAAMTSCPPMRTSDVAKSAKKGKVSVRRDPMTDLRTQTASHSPNGVGHGRPSTANRLDVGQRDATCVCIQISSDRDSVGPYGGLACSMARNIRIRTEPASSLRAWAYEYRLT